MKRIEILDFLPIVITKELNWGRNVKAVEGVIIVLPEDAVLVRAKPKVEIEAVDLRLQEQVRANTKPKRKLAQPTNLTRKL